MPGQDLNPSLDDPQTTHKIDGFTCPHLEQTPGVSSQAVSFSTGHLIDPLPYEQAYLEAMLLSQNEVLLTKGILEFGPLIFKKH